MKKIISLIIALLYLCVMTFNCYAGVDPYSFYPSKVYKPDKDFFRPVKELIDRNPLRPLVITDKNGNKSYVTSQGDVMVKVDNEGNKTFSLKGRKTHKRDVEGDLTQQWEREGGSEIVVVKNEYGETTGSEEYGMGGKVIAEYDADGNLKKSYEYNKYGKQIEWVVDELTQAKVKYDREGKALYDVDADGDEIARYYYDSKGRLDYRKDAYGNKTYYDKNGNRQKTVAEEGYTIATYKYKKDENGYYQIESVKDEINGSVTLYKNSRQQEVRNYNGLVIKKYKWHGTDLIYLEDFVTGEVTWYKNSKPTYTTFKGELVKEWMYYEGKLMGVWDDYKNYFQLYSHGEQILLLYLSHKPTTDVLLDKYKSYGMEI
jgi:hypothetical protein